MQCQYDTGSMYGCQPACSREATHVMTYGNGSYGPFTLSLCKGHVEPMSGRVYPDHAEVARLA